MNKHTPGPWQVTHPRNISTKDHGTICEPFSWMGTEEADANARLIAAAPDLLTALKELVSRCDGEDGIGQDGSNIQTIAAHAAIKKAEGES